MRLISDPQPAIEWFCTGGFACIGVEEPRDPADVDAWNGLRLTAVARPVRSTRLSRREGSKA